MAIQLTDQQFLDYFDLTRPSMKTAQELAGKGEYHAAAISAAKNASEGVVRGPIHGRDLAATREAIQKYYPKSVDLELETAQLHLLPAVPSPSELGYLKDHRIGIRARIGRKRG